MKPPLRVAFFLFAFFLAALLLGAPAQAQQPDAALQRQVQADLAGPDLQGKDGPLSKVGPDLARLYRRYERYVQQGRVGTFSAGGASARVQRGGYVTVDAIATEGDAQELRAALERLGLKNSAVSGPLVGGALPIEAIAEAARLGTLRFARPAVPALNVGAVTSQGVAAMRADVAREAYGVDGTGATVGVLSDSYDCVGDAADDVGGDDLPGAEQLRVLREEPGCVSGTDEGRAMLQIAYDVAPGANFIYHTAFNTEAIFAEGIRLLAQEGAGIIVDDIIYLNEPMFQDGQVAQAVDEVVAGGAAYFSSAGNNGDLSYESAFRDSGEPGVISPDNEGSTMHDFDPGAGVDVFQTITVPVTGDTTVPSVQFSVQWDQPYASAGGPGAPTDIDVALFTMDGTLIETAVGGADNNGEGAGSRADPTEVFGFANGGNYDSDDDGEPDTQFQLAIERFDGPAPDLIKYVVFTNDVVTVDEYMDGGSTAFGHANAAGALSVGAASYFNTDVFNENVEPLPALVNDFSALGGVPILFDLNGTRLADPLVRQKPEIVAPNGVNTTFFGADLPADFDDLGDDDDFPNFFGTSAAAPHAAGVAALMRSRNQELAPLALYDILIATAADMDDAVVNPDGSIEDDGTFDEGFDFKTGFGFIQADEAVRRVPNDLIRFEVAAAGGVANAAVLTWTFGADSGVDSVYVQRREIDQEGTYVELGAMQEGGENAFDIIESLAVTNAGAPFSFPVENLGPGEYEFRLLYVKQEEGERVPALSFARSVTIELQAADFQLMGPYPNPARAQARFDLVVAREQEVEVSVFNVLGQRIPSQAEEGQAVEMNLRKTYTFDARRLAPGVYFVRFAGEDFTETRRMVVVR